MHETRGERLLSEMIETHCICWNLRNSGDKFNLKGSDTVDNEMGVTRGKEVGK